MPKICYIPKSFSADKLEAIRRANQIMEEYARMGFDLTLRQLYYQFVSRAWIPNKQTEYAKLGDLISDARLAGLVDWNHIVDRTRNLQANTHWERPEDILLSAAHSFALDKWKPQKTYVEVWVEKDALLGIVGQTAARLDCPFFSCRGYTSQSEMWGAGQRLLRVIKSGRTPHIIHLGDHDPSGQDMSRDILDRLKLFCGQKVHVLRAALNMLQIQRFNPPPNPAKVTDSRYEAYREKYGEESWELDALDPRTLADIITRAVALYRDDALFEAEKRREGDIRKRLRKLADRWEEISKGLA